MSSCYSGQFVPALAGDNRMIMTAARPDRTSFGCGEMDHYTFFDDCFLRAMPMAGDFPGLGGLVQQCVAFREQQMKATPPSEPQVSVGPSVIFTLRWRDVPPGVATAQIDLQPNNVRRVGIGSPQRFSACRTSAMPNPTTKIFPEMTATYPAGFSLLSKR